ncbi:hypothetical protein NL676_036451 [Syzygium grande]|nr:hypothetical protein NL676_036451 [Syzygium grande]
MQLTMELERLACIFILSAMLHASSSIDWSMAQNSHHRPHHIHVGVILDMESPVGEMAQQCMTMAISDLNASPSHINHHRKLILHPRNSMGQPLKALSSAVELLENERKHDSANKLGHLVHTILQIKFTGLSGEIQLKNGQLQQPLAFEIVNVVGRVKRIGFWTQLIGIMRGLNRSSVATQSPSVRKMSSIRWPGSSLAIPKSQQIVSKAGKRLRIGVPIPVGFKEFIGVELDPETNAATVTGFCVDVFKAAIDMLPYEVKFDFIPFTNSNRVAAGNHYDNLISIPSGNLE